MSESEPLDLGGLLRQAQEFGEHLAEAEAALDDRQVEGSAGGGAVRITVSGSLEFRAVRIDPAAVDPTEVELLEDMVLAAINDAVAQAQDLRSEVLGDVAPGLLGDDPPGLGGTPGLLGGDGPGSAPEDGEPGEPGEPGPGRQQG
ncbi:MAG: YbaB/EbfC family nucleoid-associated protein [Acidimicrobiales bacterium]